jgi:hypothetical protein|tara:strand:- start:806 stop:982 length:177 start_codon:yes stop_codon:yes gene_type:complete
MSWICEESGWTHQRVPKSLRDEADKWAQAQIAEEDDDDDDDDDSDDDDDEGEEEDAES